MRRVTSSSVEEIGYDPTSMVLCVRFLESRRVYVYYDVDSSVFEDFLQAESKGKYFNSAIKGNYRYDRLR